MQLVGFILFSFLSVLCAEEAKICLNMIVKNESHVITRCLESVKPFIDSWVIVDTGSTDGTQEIIKEYLSDIPGELYERPWVNFEHNRNEALSLAKDIADYVFFIDADDLLSISPDFEKENLDKDAYYVTIDYSGTSYDRIHLIKNIRHWKWMGVVHEVLVSKSPQDLGKLKEIKIVIVGGGDRSHSPAKFISDVIILEKALQKEPKNARYVFYLAQSYRDAGFKELALKNYQKRVGMGGWDQEIFWSLYQVALLCETLSLENEIIDSYFEAYHYRSSRAEPLYRLGHYYRLKENYLLGYLLTQFGLEIELSTDSLFVESWIYEYGMLLEYSISSYWIGRYQESYEACQKLLDMPNIPDSIRRCTESNVLFALEKLEQAG